MSRSSFPQTAIAGVLLLIVTGACPGRDTAERDSNLLGLWIFSLAARIVDNGDGTITYTFYHFRTVPGHSAIYKKCVQGQVYRPATNDCQGTGTASDSYGAQTFQFCDGASGSCMGKDATGRLRLNGTGNSEVWSTCAAESLGGRMWRAPAWYYFGASFNESTLAHLPVSFYWRDDGRANRFPSVERLDPPNTERGYVICWATGAQ